MHTFETHGILFHYNSDGSGQMIIKPRNSKDNTYLPCEAVVSFVAHLVRNLKIGALEEMSDYDILGIPDTDTDTGV